MQPHRSEPLQSKAAAQMARYHQSAPLSVHTGL
jgi:hypothetical protein